MRHCNIITVIVYNYVNVRLGRLYNQNEEVDGSGGGGGGGGGGGAGVGVGWGGGVVSILVRKMNATVNKDWIHSYWPKTARQKRWH